MEKNDILTVTCEALAGRGEGIARQDGVTLFVPYLLEGERARVRVLKVKGGIGYAKIEELITPAEERVRPKCPVFMRCGGCQLQHLRYREQLKFKAKSLQDALFKIGGISVPVQKAERSDKEYGYRNKLQLPVGKDGERNVVGFFAERSHRIVPAEVCPIHPAWSEKVIAALLSFMEKCGLDGYDEETRQGQIRHIVVRELRKKYIVTLVVTVEEIKGIDYFLYLLDGIFPEYSLYLNLNDADTNVVFGEKFRLIRGEGSYECSDMGIRYVAGPNTFVQVNDAVREKLYEEVLAEAEGEVAFDCYSGGGMLTALLAQKCGKAFGIEVVPEAHRCAEELARRNGLEGEMIPVLGKVEEKLREILPDRSEGTVVLDPPRAGAERSVLGLLLEKQPKKILMISCNPATLARDLGILAGTLAECDGELKKQEGEGLYEISRIQPFDMFPQTKHIETLAVLSRRD